MREDADFVPNVQKAIAFFTDAGLTRLLEAMREKYIEVGSVGGQVIIDDSTPNERRELASFLGKTPFTSNTIKVRLHDVDFTLRQSGFACTLPDVLRAFHPEQPLVTRKERRNTHLTHQTDFRTALHTVVEQTPEETRGQRWLTQGQHGVDWLYSRYKNMPKDEQGQQIQNIRRVTHALNELPSPPHPERLALFAQRISGDPHALDTNTSAGRLFLFALSDLASNNEKEPQAKVDAEEMAIYPQQDRMQELRLYAQSGLRVDTISSSVAVFNLTEAIDHVHKIDKLPSIAGRRVLLLPLRQIMEWHSAVPATNRVYVCENPQVFEEVVEHCQASRTYPTVICTSGWPSVAALMLLDLLLAQAAENMLYYSGDFDGKGLQIAAYLMARYHERCHPWQFDSTAYAVALRNGGILASQNELAMLNALPPVFAKLVNKMQERGMWAYQEGITSLLVEDLNHF